MCGTNRYLIFFYACTNYVDTLGSATQKCLTGVTTISGGAITVHIYPRASQTVVYLGTGGTGTGYILYDKFTYFQNQHKNTTALAFVGIR